MQSHTSEMKWMLGAARTPRLRTHRQFAEQEITLPNTGPRGGRKWKATFQPYSAIWLNALGDRQFNRFAATGPSQSGKTLQCHVIPVMYHLFERRENVIAFSPSMEICEQKWLIDMLPTLQLSRFDQYLPKRGGGAKGGFDELIRFDNGTYLKFMTGGGGDKNKSAITAKVACGTEVDGMAEGSSTSVESTPLNQIAARLRSHGSRAVMYLECTVSVEKGIIWQELQKGTCSRIVLQCVHCSEWVTPEREDFIGWENAENEIVAEGLGKFFCPDCGGAWTPEQRKAANQTAKLVHKGQTIDRHGTISGPVPETRTFGFRWSVVNNMFAEESTIGAEEWKAARNPDRDAAEKERCQFVWAIPFQAEKDSIELTESMIASRLSGIERYTVPNDTETLVVKIDLHSRRHYYGVMATSPNRVRSFVDYDIIPTPFEDETTRTDAMRAGLEIIEKRLADTEWKRENGSSIDLDLIVCDAGYEEEMLLEFIAERRGNLWRLDKGTGSYKQPKEWTADVHPGEHWFDHRQPGKPATRNKKWWLAITDTDWWMRQVHQGFKASTFSDNGTRQAGSIGMWGSDPEEHCRLVDRNVGRSAWATQLLAWLWEEVANRSGVVEMKWVPQYSDGKDDHWFDIAYGCLVADQIARETVCKRRLSRPTNETTKKEKQPVAPPPRHFRWLSSGEVPKLS
jgi:hypothetical protein